MMEKTKMRFEISPTLAVRIAELARSRRMTGEQLVQDALARYCDVHGDAAKGPTARPVIAVSWTLLERLLTIGEQAFKTPGSRMAFYRLVTHAMNFPAHKIGSDTLRTVSIDPARNGLSVFELADALFHEANPNGDDGEANDKTETPSNE